MIDKFDSVLSAQYFVEVREKGRLIQRTEVKNALNNGLLALLQGARMQFERPDATFNPVSGYQADGTYNFHALQNIGCYDSSDVAEALPEDLGEVSRHPAIPRGVISSGTITGAPYGAYTATKRQATLNKITKVGSFTAAEDFMLTHLSGFRGTDVTVPQASTYKYLSITGYYQTINTQGTPGASSALCAAEKLIGVISREYYQTSGYLLLFRWDEDAGVVTYLKAINGYVFCFTDGTNLYAVNTATQSIDLFDSTGTVVQSTPIALYSSLPQASAAIVCQTAADVWIASMQSLAKLTIATGAVQVYTPTWPSNFSSINKTQLISDGQGKHIFINGYAFDMADFLTGVITPVITTGTTKLAVGIAVSSPATRLKENLWLEFTPSAQSYTFYLSAPVQEIGSFAALPTPVQVLAGQDVTLGYTITYNDII